MSCDDTACRPGLKGHFFLVWEVQARLFHGQVGNSFPSVTSTRSWKRAGMKAYLSACSTGPKVSPMLRVTRCTNAHLCWNDSAVLRKGNPRQRCHRLRPPLYLLCWTAVLNLSVADKYPKLLTPWDDLYPHSPEEVLHSCHLLQWYNQDTICWFWEVSLRWPPNLQVPEVCKDFTKCSSYPCVICIPWMGDARVCTPEALDER